MPDAAPTARDVDRVAGPHRRVETRERRQEGHRKRRRIAEADRRWLASGQELAREGVAASAWPPSVGAPPPSPFKSAIAATASPTATPLTPSPTATTAPARSSPRATGGVRP